MLKRSIDFMISAAGLALLAPLFAAIAVAVKLDSPGGVFYRQVRMGRGGTRFRIFKFRSMVSDADRRGGKLTVGGDARVTRVGRFLRRHKLDELPQLINVLTGDMSLVGPRPEVPEYADMFPAEFERILEVRPGITHRATLKFRNEEEILAAAGDPATAYVEKVMPHKMRLYVDSLASQSVLDDVMTIVDTVFQVGESLTADELGLDTPAVSNVMPFTRVAPAPMAQPVVAAPVSPPRRVRQGIA